jgi:hypothetical protein
MTENNSAPAVPEIPPGSISLPTRKTKTTVANDAARLIQLAVMEVYPKTFETTAIMNGYPIKCPEEVSGFRRELQFPTAQTMVRRGDVAGSTWGGFEAK